MAKSIDRETYTVIVILESTFPDAFDGGPDKDKCHKEREEAGSEVTHMKDLLKRESLSRCPR